MFWVGNFNLRNWIVLALSFLGISKLANKITQIFFCCLTLRHAIDLGIIQLIRIFNTSALQVVVGKLISIPAFI